MYELCSSASSVSEYKCAEDLFADIGIQFIDCEEAEAGPGLDQEEDTSASSFSSTQDPGLELGGEMREAASLGQGLARQADMSDYSGTLCNHVWLLLNIYTL